MEYSASMSAVQEKPVSGRLTFARSAVVFLWVLAASATLLIFSFLSYPKAICAGAVLVCLTLVIQVVRNHGLVSGPVLLFAMTLSVFVWARPMISFSSRDFDLRTIEVFSGISVSEAGQRVYLAAVVCTMVAFSMTVLFHQLPTRRNARSRALPLLPSLPPYSSSIWRLFFWIGVAASFLQSALYLRYFLEGGSYYDLYILGQDAVGFAGLSFLASFLFYGYIGLLLGTYRSDHNCRSARRLWTVLFVVLSIFGLARGSRGEVFTQLLVGLWLFSFTRGKTISIRTWSLYGAGLFLLSEGIGQLRSGNRDLISANPMLKALEWFTYTQGLSGQLVAIADEKFGVGFSNIRFIFSPLLAPLRRIFDPSFGSQTVRYGESSGLLAHELAFRVAPEYYLAGHAAGSSYIAETYCAFGLLGVIAATAALTWIVLSGPDLARRSQSAFFVFAASLPYILFVPRESLVFPLVPALKALLLFLICRRLRNLYVYYSHRTDI